MKFQNITTGNIVNAKSEVAAKLMQKSDNYTPYVEKKAPVKKSGKK